MAGAEENGGEGLMLVGRQEDQTGGEVGKEGGSTLMCAGCKGPNADAF